MSQPQKLQRRTPHVARKHRGILFTGHMMLANLAGIKSQTRRPINPQPHKFPEGWSIPGLRHKLYGSDDINALIALCPYGVVGDLLYARENLFLDPAAGGWAYRVDGIQIEVDKHEEAQAISWAFHKEMLYASSIHMPRFASRFWMEILDVRVETLHDIKAEDAIAEGINMYFSNGVYKIPIFKTAPAGSIRTKDPVEAYIYLYNQINGLTMQQNPYTWAITYKSTEKPKLELEVSNE